MSRMILCLKSFFLLIALCGVTGALYSESPYFTADGEPNYELLLNNPPQLSNYLNSPEYPNDFWKTSTPEAQGMNPALLATMVSNMRENFYPGNYEIHSLLIVRNGYLVMERYGFDSAHIHKMHNIPMSYFQQPSPDRNHNVFSITKSVTSALVGIAIQEGAIKDVHQKVIDFCDGLAITNPDPRISNITIENLLTMTSGIDWDDNNSSKPEFYDAKDIPSLYMNQPIKTNAGILWNYDTFGVRMLGYVLQRAVKTNLIEYADQKLFKPLGITNFYWYVPAGGIADTGAGLSMTSRDLAKFGYLYLNKGKWQGKQIVPEDWVAQSTSLKITGKWGGYGYLWMVKDNGIYNASGFGGQTLYIIPDKKLVVAITSWVDPGTADRTLFYNATNYIIPSAK